MDVIDRMDGDSRASPALWEMLFCYVTCRMHFMFTTRVVVCPLEGWYLCACYFLEIKLEEGLYIYNAVCRSGSIIHGGKRKATVLRLYVPYYNVNTLMINNSASTWPAYTFRSL